MPHTCSYIIFNDKRKTWKSRVIKFMNKDTLKKMAQDIEQHTMDAKKQQGKVKNKYGEKLQHLSEKA